MNDFSKTLSCIKTYFSFTYLFTLRNYHKELELFFIFFQNDEGSSKINKKYNTVYLSILVCLINKDL
jgi:hypothetical protein